MTPVLKYTSAAAGLLLLAATSAPASAQKTLPGGSASPNMQDQNGRTPPPARPRSERPRPESPGESLGQAPSSGVIQPPETGDNGVIAPRNRTNTPMPEVRPPGTPGGNPNVQPK